MFSIEALFAKYVLLHVFTSVAIHVALLITTKYCSNKAIPLLYILLFYSAVTSFTSTFVISGKSFHRS